MGESKMATTQYIGARYVPLFAEPVEWDKTKQYEPLTIVTNSGNSYTSRQFVPTGIEITNEEFWALTGNYNAQIEQYRNEVSAYDNRITTAQDTADSAKTSADSAKTSADAANAAVTAEQSRAEAKEAEIQSLADSAKTSADAANAAVTAEQSRAKAKEAEIQSLAETNETNIAHIDAQLAGTSNSGLLDRVNAISAKFPVGTADLADGAVTASKLSNNAISSIFAGLTVRRFDSSDAKADNDGLVVPNSQSRLAGYWIPELGMLVINALNSDHASFPKVGNGATSAFKLPSYVNYPSSDLYVTRAAFLVWNSSDYFKSWEAMTINSKGYVGAATTDFSENESVDLFGSQVCFLSPTAKGTEVTADVYGSFAEHNEVI